jgi:galactoside O-acetyltransferase
VTLDDPEREVRRRMAAQELYSDGAPGLERLEEERFRGKELADRYNRTGPRDRHGRREILAELFGSLGERVWIEPPLHVAYGSHVHLGDDVYANFGLTLVDDGEVFVGDRVMFAPHVTVSTTGHPVHPELRRDGTQFSAPVRFEDDVWIGAGALIMPGVTVGRGSVVGAGSVVTADVPPMVVVAGTPARILRRITDADREWTYRPPRTLEPPADPPGGPRLPAGTGGEVAAGGDGRGGTRGGGSRGAEL